MLASPPPFPRPGSVAGSPVAVPARREEGAVIPEGDGALSLLFLTPLDYLAAHNNREHNAVRFYARRGDRVEVVAKRLNRRGGWRAALRDGLTTSTTTVQRDGATIRTVDPLLNFYGGLARQAAAASGTADAPPRPGGRLKAAVIRALRPLSLLREAAATLALARAAWGPAGAADVVVAFGPWAALPGWFLRRTGRVRFLVYVDRDCEAGLFEDVRRDVTAFLERRLPRAADLFVTIGPRLRSMRRRTTGRDPLVCETGVDIDRFAAVRTATGPGPGRFTVLYVGNVIDWSGVDLAIGVLPDLPDHVCLRVVGGGLPSYVAALKRLAERTGVAHRVEFVGPVPHASIPALMGGAALGLALSRPNLYREYAYPLKVLEYFAAGLPVVATAGTEGGDIVRRAEAGLAIGFEPAALAGGLAALASDGARYADLRRKALVAAQTMTWARSFSRERAAVMSALPPRRATT